MNEPQPDISGTRNHPGNDSERILTMCAVGAAIVAVVLLTIAVIMSLTAVRVQGLDCDTVISYIPGSDTPEARCEDAKDSRQTTQVVLYLLAFVGLLGFVAAMGRRRKIIDARS